MKRQLFFPDFNRSQRRGIIILFLLILLGQMAIYFSKRLFKNQHINTDIPVALQQQYDSLKAIALQKNKPKIYPFNPNFLTDEKAYFLGLNLDQIDRITAYRNRGQYIQNKQSFKKIAGISDSLFKILEPYINLKTYNKQPSYRYNYHNNSTTDINKATAEDLRIIKGVGAVLSTRIIKYRNAIGGFTDQNQIKKVYGLEPEVIERIWKKFKINRESIKPNNIIVKPVNTASIEDFKEVYGIGDKLAERIVKHRKKTGGYSIPEQLNDVYGLKPEIITRFWQHFKIEKPAKIAFKINLNEANIKELAKNPYISYQLAKKIVSYRTLHGAFRNFDELLKVADYPKNIHKPICLYLKLEEK